MGGNNESPRRRNDDKPKSVLQRLKSNIVAVAAIVTAAGTLALAPIGFDERYAHADDVKTLAVNQDRNTQALRATITQQQLNWLEYYNDRIKALERERISRPAEAASINREIDDFTSRKRFLEKSLVETPR